MFLGKVRETVDSFGMLCPGEKVVAGVSGGSDSVALIFVLGELRRFYPGIDIVVCHVNHGLRGRESDQDERFVRDMAFRLGFMFECRRVDTEDFRNRNRLSLEDAGRKLRYEVFSEVMEGTSARRIATAHTLNDQAETVLMRFLRGSGARGLSGISPSDGSLIRPLINVTKDEARRWLESKGVVWREDSSNELNQFLRNRIRNELLPVLETYNPAVQRVLSRTAAVSAAEADFISREAEKKNENRSEVCRRRYSGKHRGPSSRTARNQVFRYEEINSCLKGRPQFYFRSTSFLNRRTYKVRTGLGRDRSSRRNRFSFRPRFFLLCPATVLFTVSRRNKRARFHENQG